MTKDELKTKLDTCFKNAELILQEKGSMIPMLDIELIESNGKRSLMGAVLAHDGKREKNMFIKGLGIILAMTKRLKKIQKVECIVLVSEAWFSTISKVEYQMTGGRRSPSEDPNRREMLIAVGVTEDGIVLSQSKEMFSVEVKGKRHFTLTDSPEAKISPLQSTETNMLNNFWDGYRSGMSDSPENMIWDKTSDVFSELPLNEVLERATKVLVDKIGNAQSKFINLNK